MARRGCDLNGLALAAVLFILIAVALVVVVVLGAGMCRLAALSDRQHASALADWGTRVYAIEHEPWTADRAPEGLPVDSQGEAFRATG
jgi:predicted RNA methylase